MNGIYLSASARLAVWDTLLEEKREGFLKRLNSLLSAIIQQEINRHA